MSKIKLVFPNGHEALATVREQQEPALSKALYSMLLNGPLKCSCHHTVSTGSFFAASPRPPAHPVENGSQTQGVGNSGLQLICDLEAGDISFTGLVFWMTYGFCSEAVPIGGPVIAKVDPAYLDGFIAGGKDIWDHEYRKRELGIMTIEKVEE